MAKIHPADLEAGEYLEKQKKTRSGPADLLLTLSVCLIVLALVLLFFILPKNEYSKTENRTLAALPEFSTSDLDDGTFAAGTGALMNRYFPFFGAMGNFTRDTVSYIKDHFPFRDGLLAANAVYDLASLRFGSGGIALGKDGYLLYEEHYATEEEKDRLRRSVRVIRALSEDLPTVTAIAGKGSEVLTSYYPAVLSDAPAEANIALIREALGKATDTYLDLIPLLRERQSEGIYYRTDHHWTAFGACLAANAILERMGSPAYPLEDYQKEIATDSFKGTLYNRSGMFFLPGEELFFLRYEGDGDYTVTRFDLRENADGTVGEIPISTSRSLYDPDCLEEDYRGTAYDAFVAPVSVPVVRIEKPGEERQTLLVVKDSFAHSVLPFLARSFNVVSVDIRKNADYALELIKEGKVDRVLILVNSETLFS